MVSKGRRWVGGAEAVAGSGGVWVSVAGGWGGGVLGVWGVARLGVWEGGGGG